MNWRLVLFCSVAAILAGCLFVYTRQTPRPVVLWNKSRIAASLSEECWKDYVHTFQVARQNIINTQPAQMQLARVPFLSNRLASLMREAKFASGTIGGLPPLVARGLGEILLAHGCAQEFSEKDVSLLRVTLDRQNLGTLAITVWKSNQQVTRIGTDEY